MTTSNNGIRISVHQNTATETTIVGRNVPEKQAFLNSIFLEEVSALFSPDQCFILIC